MLMPFTNLAYDPFSSWTGTVCLICSHFYLGYYLFLLQQKMAILNRTNVLVELENITI